jgi:pimeloyl-ACP methyl ester carboxylesterase
MSAIETNGVRTHCVQLAGEAGGPCEDLVMVHGLGTSLSFWYLPHAARFAQRYRVTLYDLRGHGRSSMPTSGYAPAMLAQDLEALMDELGIERAHFVAHSFGGVVALSLARARPERFIDLVLADTQISGLRHLSHPQHGQLAEQLQRLLERYGVALDADDPYFGFRLLGAVARLELQGVELPQELLLMLGPLAGKNSKRTARLWLQLLASTSAERELTSDDGLTEGLLRRLEFPVLAMYGERSRAAAAGQYLADVLPRATWCPVPRAGHFFPSTQSELFIERCNAFWATDEVARPAGHAAVHARSTPPAQPMKSSA